MSAHRREIHHLLSAFIQKEWKSPARHPFDWRGFVAIALFMPLAIYALARLKL